MYFSYVDIPLYVACQTSGPIQVHAIVAWLTHDDDDDDDEVTNKSYNFLSVCPFHT